jgi:hypothetical protein
MSIIACKVLKNRIEIAGDSATTYGGTLQVKSENDEAKIFKTNDIIIGGVGKHWETGLFRLFSNTRKPKGNRTSDILDFYCEFLDFKKNKTTKYEINNNFIFIFAKKAFKIEDMCVDEIYKYHAIGCAMESALSAMYLGHGTKKAVEVACELSPFCAKPIHYFEVKI